LGTFAWPPLRPISSIYLLTAGGTTRLFAIVITISSFKSLHQFHSETISGLWCNKA
jgi:hypothetical protein